MLSVAKKWLARAGIATRRINRALAWTWRWLPLTPLGLIGVVALQWLFRTYAVRRQDKVFLAVCVCGLGLIALQTAIVLLTALWLKLRRERPCGPLEFETGVPKRTGHRLGIARWNPLVKVDVEWLEPASAIVQFVSDGQDIVEEVTAGDRGAFSRVVRRYRVSDVFGIARFYVRRKVETPVVVKPNCGRVHSLHLIPQDVPGEQLSDPRGAPRGDLVDMRPYAPGDPLKLVLWKQYARSGRLLVRQPERAVSATKKTLAYLVAAETDDPSAGVARAVLEQGAIGDEFLFAADGDEQPTKESPAAIERIVRSSAARERGGEALGRFIGKGEKHGIESCLLFVPSRPGPWLERVTGHLAKKSGPCRAIVGIDGKVGAATNGILRRCLYRDNHPPAVSTAELRTVCDRLRDAGADVILINRESGEFGPATSMIG
jgi:hypothetical protein